MMRCDLGAHVEKTVPVTYGAIQIKRTANSTEVKQLDEFEEFYRRNKKMQVQVHMQSNSKSVQVLT